jgi:hypothetical protein
MKKTTAAVLTLCACLFVVPVSANEFQVIGHSSVPADVSAADLKEIFLGNKTSVGGGSVEPVLSPTRRSSRPTSARPNRD